MPPSQKSTEQPGDAGATNSGGNSEGTSPHLGVFTEDEEIERKRVKVTFKPFMC